MIRKSLLLLLLLGPAAVGARAQSNYQPGYVLTPAGDTLRGLLGLTRPANRYATTA